MIKANAGEPRVVSPDEWVAARIGLLKKEREFVRMRDELSAEIRSLPWEPVDKTYRFDGPDGSVALSDLFGPHSQLIVYHFMFEPEWEEGCKSCSLIADGLEPAAVHLGARDVAVAMVSRAPLNRILPFRDRMGWKLPWVSSAASDFNSDFQVSTGEVDEKGQYFYNYEMMSIYPQGEQPGLSVFVRDGRGRIFHSYSTYARGLETFIGTYRLLDVVPRGRDEDDLPWGMAWLKHHDRYEGENTSTDCCHGESE